MSADDDDDVDWMLFVAMTAVVDLSSHAVVAVVQGDLSVGKQLSLLLPHG
jgi:hypothetical protein